MDDSLKMKKRFLLKLSATLFAIANLGTISIAAADNLEEGKKLFMTDAQPMACAICHALEDASATGNIGPDLDDLRPDADRIHKVLIEGMGAMPAFGDSLSQEQRDAIVDYVISATN